MGPAASVLLPVQRLEQPGSREGHRNTKSLLTAALSTALFFFGAAPVQAQAGLVSKGHGTFQVFTQPAIIGFTFAVAEEPDGSTNGIAIFQGFPDRARP
ncbi:MAG TPA: hypothetical protein VF384_14165 [Planctomycetota bacterium]